MIGLLLGFALGGIAFTEQGREFGDKMFNMAVNKVKEVTKHEEDREVKQDD